jgi:hypothetical protein
MLTNENELERMLNLSGVNKIQESSDFRYPVNIDLAQLPLMQRNRIVDFVTRSGTHYQLENQVIGMDLNTAVKLFNTLMS